MKKTLFVLLIMAILAGALSALFIYDKKILEQEENGQIVDENQMIQDESFENTQTINEKEQDENTQQDEILGKLIINKISLNGEVKEGCSSEILEEYIGHIEETSKFDGNVGLAAHNRGNKYSYFARINELDNGDEIIYQTKYGTKKYIVTNKKEILETDWSMLKNTKENKLTLITCIRNKVNQRMCVQAIEQET